MLLATPLSRLRSPVPRRSKPLHARMEWRKDTPERAAGARRHKRTRERERCRSVGADGLTPGVWMECIMLCINVKRHVEQNVTARRTDAPVRPSNLCSVSARTCLVLAVLCTIGRGLRETWCLCQRLATRFFSHHTRQRPDCLQAVCYVPMWCLCERHIAHT